MAALAVCMVGTRTVVRIVGGRHDVAAGLMLVSVMAEVLLRRGTGFMSAVRRCRAPDQLERHDKQQQSEYPTAHESDYVNVDRGPSDKRGEPRRLGHTRQLQRFQQGFGLRACFESCGAFIDTPASRLSDDASAVVAGLTSSKGRLRMVEDGIIECGGPA